MTFLDLNWKKINYIKNIFLNKDEHGLSIKGHYRITINIIRYKRSNYDYVRKYLFYMNY